MRGVISMPTLRNFIGGFVFSRGSFEFLQKHGVHVVRNQFYGPIPDTARLDKRDGFFTTENELTGVDMNVPGQLELLHDVIAPHLAECTFPKHATSVPYEYFIFNNYFGHLSATVLHSIVRQYKPKLIIEVG